MKITKQISLLALFAVLAGCGSPVASKEATSAPAQMTTEVVKRQDLVGYSFFNGKLVVPESAQASASSPYDAPLASVSTSVGKMVERGDPIIKITVAGAEESANMAKADATAAARSYSDEKANGSGPVKEAEQALAAARTEEKAAKADVAAGGTADVAAATEVRVQAETALQQAKSELRKTLQPTKNAVNQTEANLIAARADAQKGIVRAPISGTVVSLDAKAGQMAKSGVKLVTIINFNAVRVQGVVPPELKDLVAKDSSVIIRMSGPSADPLDGKVVDLTVLPPSPGQASSGYLAVIVFLNTKGIVLPTTSVRSIGVKTGTAQNVLVVPVGSVTKKDGKSFVSVQTGTEWVPTAVELGISDGALVEIKSGLKEGAVVRVQRDPEATSTAIANP